MVTYEALPQNYTLKREVDFAGFSKENWIGCLVSLVLIAACVLLALPTHPFVLLSQAKDSIMSLIYCIALFALLMISVRLQEKLHGYVIYKLCGCPVEYNNSMGIYLCASSGRYYVSKKNWILSSLLPVVFWCAMLLVFSFALGSNWFWAPYLLFLVSLASVGGKVVGTAVLLQYPSDTYVQDDGAVLRVYTTIGEA